MIEAIEDMGFDVEDPDQVNDLQQERDLRTTLIHVEGMTCGSCTKSITASLVEMGGVMEVDVSLTDKLATIKHDANIISEEELRSHIDDIGFESTIEPEGE